MKRKKKTYEEAIPNGTVKDIVAGALGIDLKKNRNFILDYYP